MKSISFGSVLYALCLSMGCHHELVDELLLEPDPNTNTQLGMNGEWGARLWTGTLEGSGDIELVVPEGIDAPIRGLFVFGQGGAIQAQRYRWLSAHVASRGFVVLTPVGLFDWGAFLSGADMYKAVQQLHLADEPFDGLTLEDVPITYGGHSRGGVNAADAYAFSVNDGIETSLVLLESYPNPAHDFSGLEGMVVAIAGSKDERVNVEKVEEGAAAFDESWMVTIDGMNHYQLTESPTESELGNDGTPTIDIETARYCTLVFVDALLETSTTGDESWFHEPQSWPACVER